MDTLIKAPAQGCIAGMHALSMHGFLVGGVGRSLQYSVPMKIVYSTLPSGPDRSQKSSMHRSIVVNSSLSKRFEWSTRLRAMCYMRSANSW